MDTSVRELVLVAGEDEAAGGAEHEDLASVRRRDDDQSVTLTSNAGSKESNDFL